MNFAFNWGGGGGLLPIFIVSRSYFRKLNVTPRRYLDFLAKHTIVSLNNDVEIDGDDMIFKLLDDVNYDSSLLSKDFNTCIYTDDSKYYGSVVFAVCPFVDNALSPAVFSG